MLSKSPQPTTITTMRWERDTIWPSSTSWMRTACSLTCLPPSWYTVSLSACPCSAPSPLHHPQPHTPAYSTLEDFYELNMDFFPPNFLALCSVGYEAFPGQEGSAAGSQGQRPVQRDQRQPDGGSGLQVSGYTLFVFVFFCHVLIIFGIG